MKLLSFEKQFGKGVDPWYKKLGRWVKKKFKNPYLRHLALGFIEWLKQKWIGVKIDNTMQNVDAQIKEIKEEWDEEERRQFAPEFTIVEEGVFGDEGWSIEISNPIVERGTDSTSTGMVAPSDAQRLQQDEGDSTREE